MAKYITVYDSEKYKTTGNGTKKIKITEEFENLEERKKIIEKMRAEQKNKNMEYKISLTKIHEDEILNKTDENEKLEIPEPTKLSNILYINTPILKLDPGTGNTTILIASSKAGKTFLSMKLYDKYYEKKENINILFSINSQISLYRKGKNLLKYNSFDENAVNVIKMCKLINTKTKNKYSFNLFFDDVLNTRYSALFNNLICTYRNSKISTMICLQYPFLIAKSNRCNVNNVFLGSLLTDEAIESVLKIYLISHFKKQGITKMSDMINYYRYLTKDHGFIYIAPSKSIIKYVRLIK